MNRPGPRPRRPELVVYDGSGKLLLVARIEAAYPLEDEERAEFISSLSAQHIATPFALLLDTQSTTVLHLGAGSSGANRDRVEATTREVLAAYDPAFGSKPITQNYLEVLTESWLQDLMLNWKHPDPPLRQQLETIGLLPQLREGYTSSESSARLSSSSSSSSSSFSDPFERWP